MRESLPLCLGQKQHISISQYAYDVLVSDSLTFIGKKNLSGFVNTIVYNSGINYFDDMQFGEQARIEDELKKSRTTITDLDKESIIKIASAHVKAHMNMYVDSNSAYKHKTAFKIRLNDKLHRELYPANGEWMGTKYHIRQGEFIRSILEDYARKPLFERESVFFKKNIDHITSHIMSSDAKKGILPIELVSNRKMYVKPYRMSENFEAPYHYLICMASYSPDKDYFPTSIRLSNIREVNDSLSSYISGKITKKEQAELEKRIKNNKVPYVFGETIEIQVKLTKDGISKYNSIFHQRPMYELLEECKDGSGAVVLFFNSTERQIMNYFFQFGKDAVVMYPLEVTCTMYERFKNAFDSYNDLKTKENIENNSKN